MKAGQNRLHCASQNFSHMANSGKELKTQKGKKEKEKKKSVAIRGLGAEPTSLGPEGLGRTMKMYHWCFVLFVCLF